MSILYYFNFLFVHSHKTNERKGTEEGRKRDGFPERKMQLLGKRKNSPHKQTTKKGGREKVLFVP